MNGLLTFDRPCRSPRALLLTPRRCVGNEHARDGYCVAGRTQKSSGNRSSAADEDLLMRTATLEMPPAPRVGADASDGVLVRQVADGDHDALATLYDRYTRPAFALAR